jgi:exosortase family protein XrtF
MNWREFKPTLTFLGRFLGLYLVTNFLYGLAVTAWAPVADPLTRSVTEQTAAVVSMLGYPSSTRDVPGKATVSIVHAGRGVVSVYEGCNGANVVLIFLSFLLAFGPYRGAMVWFGAAGMLLIHLANLGRIGLLFYVSLRFPDYLYFVHKYLFTASIYALALLLWMVWIRYFTAPRT